MSDNTPRIDKRTTDDHWNLMVRSPIDIGGNRYPNGLRERFTPGWAAAEDVEKLDLGMVMTRAVARLMDVLVQRVNHIPKKHKAAFLNLIGIEAKPGSPARAPVTFIPAPKTPDGRHISKGTQVATTQTSTSPAVIFETDTGFDLSAATLVKAVTITPQDDCYREIEDELVDGGTGAPVLMADASDRDVEHSLYLAHEGFFTLDTSPTITIRFCFSDPGDLYRCYVWEVYEKGIWTGIKEESLGMSTITPDGYEIRLLSFPGTETSKVLESEAAWIRWRNLDPLTVDSGDLPVITDIKVKAEPNQVVLPPDAAYTNTFAVDLNRDFYPFGERPKQNDAFYISCEEAFTHTDPIQARTITINWKLAPIPGAVDANMQYPDENATAVISWEYWNGTVWTPILGTLTGNGDFKTPIAEVGETKSFGFPLPEAISPVKVGKEKANWIRARIVKGDFGIDAVTSLSVVDNNVNYTYTDPTYRPPFLSITDFGIEYANAEENAYVAPTAIRCVNNFEVATPGDGAFSPFVPATVAHTEPALYLGYDAVFGNRPISQLLEVLSPSPSLLAAEQGDDTPVLIWEYLDTDDSWQRLDVEENSAGLANTATLQFVAPEDMGVGSRFGETAAWIRARLVRGVFSQPRRLINVHTNTVWADSIRTVKAELVGSGTGQLSQTLYLSHSPVLEGEQILVREASRPAEDALAGMAEEEAERASQLGVSSSPIMPEQPEGEDGTWVRWQPVANFRFSSPTSRHYVIDRITGQLTFGAMPDEPQFQALPLPIGRNNVVAEVYRANGGEGGNRPKDTIVQLKSALPFVAAVRNPIAAAGGAPPETLEKTLARGPATLKHRNRAVTPDDYSALAKEASAEVALVRTLPITNPAGKRELGAVTVMIVPQSEDRRPAPSAELLGSVRRYLSWRAPETANHRLYLIGPTYTSIAVTVIFVPADPAEANLVICRVVADLDQYLHPLKGGPENAGWTFGNQLYLSNIYARIEAVEGVDFVVTASFESDPSATVIDIPPNQLVSSGVHRVVAVSQAEAVRIGTAEGA